jgi:hypothetical protein
MERGEMDGETLDAAAAILSAAFDKAALDIASGKPATAYKAAIRRILEGFFKQG